MADISRYLNAILSAIYGEEVRGSIHDAIRVINNEVESSSSGSSSALAKANEALSRSATALTNSQNAVATSNSAFSNSAEALAKSNYAVATADTALAKSIVALDKSIEALDTANSAKEISQNAYNIVVNLRRIINDQLVYIDWVYEYMQIVDSTTENIVIDDLIQDSNGNNILDSNGDTIGERTEGFAAFVRLVMEHIERTA